MSNSFLARISILDSAGNFISLPVKRDVKIINIPLTTVRLTKKKVYASRHKKNHANEEHGMTAGQNLKKMLRRMKRNLGV